MKAILTAACLALLLASAADPVSAADQKEKKVNKIVTIEKHLGGAWLGVALQDVTEELSKEKNLSLKEGAFVTEVVDGSPADSIGIMENDLITEINGKTTASAEDVITMVGKMKSGETASVTVLRDGAKKTFSVKLSERPAMERRMEIKIPSMPPMSCMPQMRMHGMQMPPIAALDHRAGVEGMKLMELTDQLGKYFDAPDSKALLVTNVKKNSNARKAGIEAGDVIFRIGKTDIEDMKDLHAALKEVKEGTTVEVQLIRKGARKTVKLEISHQADVRMDFHGTFPGHGTFNLEQFGLDRECLRDMMKDLKPQMDRIRKEVRIRIHDGNVITEETEDTEEPGTEL